MINESTPRQMEPCGELEAKISVPGSKSITNRALICAALAKGRSNLSGVLESDDSRVMIEGLRSLGFEVDWDAAACSATVHGLGGRVPAGEAHIDVQGSGTTMRFLSAICCLGQGQFVIDGNERMRQRPIGDLVQSLGQLGCQIQSAKANQFPPVSVTANGINGGTTVVAGDQSSQFLSGLLLASPSARETVKIEISGQLVSRPFVQLTLDLMKTFGVQAESNRELNEFVVAPQVYQPRDYQVEPDATAASYFWAAAAICGGSVLVHGLDRHSIQGDMAFVEVLRKMGCKTVESAEGLTVIGPAKDGVDVEMGDFSDTVQTVAAVALFVNGTTTIRGIAHNRHKESDRIGDLATELRRVGAVVEEFPDGIRIEPGQLQPTYFETYDDHRMAMALSLIGLRQRGIFIKNPGCTRKTFPAFFDTIDLMLQQIKR